jgi:hypothetical protein
MLTNLFVIFSINACMLLLLIGVGNGLFFDPRPFDRHSWLSWVIRIAHSGFFIMLVLAWIGMVLSTIQGTLI